LRTTRSPNSYLWGKSNLRDISRHLTPHLYDSV
jgi:hypothetical protein